MHSVTLPPADVALGNRLRIQHASTSGVVEEVCAIADGLSTQDPEVAPVWRLLERLHAELLPHERADEELLVPLVARALGPPPPRG